MDGVTAIANVLKLEGVEWIGCMPSNPLIEAAAIAGIRPIVVRQERTGIHMADGFSRINNGQKIGIFLMQAGPGAENAFGGVAQAYADSVPILLLPAGASRRRSNTDPVFNPTISYQSITKWAAQINFADRVPELMRRAYTSLRSGKPGPVLLEIPGDLHTEQIGEEDFDYEPPVALRTAGDPYAIDKAAQALLNARRPVIFAGQGVLYADATQELLEIAEYLQIPVMTTLEGKSAFPENHSLSLGIGGSSTTEAVHEFLNASDLVFGIGASFTKSNFTVPIPSGKTLIHATNCDSDINKDYKSQHPIVGDAKLVLNQFLENAKTHTKNQPRQPDTELTTQINHYKQHWLDQWMPRLTSEEIPINPYRVVWDIMKAVDLDNTIVTHESGSSREQVTPFWEARAPRSFIGWGKSTQLGYSLGLAFGAKLAAPEKQVINFMGDAAFGMVGLDVETAVREGIPITTIVMNNYTMGIYSDSRMPTAVERYQTKKLSGEFSEVAKALGAYSEKVTEPSEIIPAMKRAQAANESGQAALLEFITKEDGTFSKF
ncbi:MAG: thiamine pyrophosphate-requiring protein [Chloroflexota bacterium]|nr:thiamine pyrophosphate-requiring protein [Chloroflexota bacterium]